MSITTTKTLTCDECGTETRVPGALDWWRLERHPDSLETTTLRDPDAFMRLWDLCSVACVTAWAGKR